ncbi:MAG TPA: hypothetical protein VMG12_43200 [Polyangiaceae bacterium]|nr:hypothetical protein [Polyangiaceae bacterium]
MVTLAITGLLGLSIGFFAGAGYATRGARHRRDETEQYAAECNELREQLRHLRRPLNEPASGILSKEDSDALHARIA